MALFIDLLTMMFFPFMYFELNSCIKLSFI